MKDIRIEKQKPAYLVVGAGYFGSREAAKAYLHDLDTRTERFAPEKISDREHQRLLNSIGRRKP